MTDILNELNEIAADFAEDKAEGRGQMLDTLKKDLQEVSLKLRDKQLKKAELEAQIKAINKEMDDYESEIRHKWEPLLGADSAELTLLNGVVLSAKPIMNISVEDNDSMVGWFMTHGYKEVMKYQIHHQTMKKIATDELEKGTVIPGLKYMKFTKIKVK